MPELAPRRPECRPRSRRLRPALLAATLALAIGALNVGCGADEPPALTGEQQEEWRHLQRTRGELSERRRELARWRRELEAEPAGSSTENEVSRAELAARVARTEQEIAKRSDAFGNRLVWFLGELAVPAGEPAPRELQQAIRLKSDEDLEVGADWIERGGDYRRAIEIYEMQRRHDPGYERLEKALGEARAMRFVTAERFARVDRGMTRADVRAALGPVNLRMIRSYPERGVEAWLYPKQGGGTAAVFFRRDTSRRALVVYATSFDLRAPPAARPRPAG
jgi:hypothetical protein